MCFWNVNIFHLFPNWPPNVNTMTTHKSAQLPLRQIAKFTTGNNNNYLLLPYISTSAAIFHSSLQTHAHTYTYTNVYKAQRCCCAESLPAVYLILIVSIVCQGDQTIYVDAQQGPNDFFLSNYIHTRTQASNKWKEVGKIILRKYYKNATHFICKHQVITGAAQKYINTIYIRTSNNFS